MIPFYKTVKIFICIIVISCSASLIQAARASCQLPPASEIQSIADNAISKYNMPGVQVSVMCMEDKSPQDFVSGKTEISGNENISAEHLFQIGSITKSYIAAIMLQLTAEERLKLTDPISLYLPELPSTWQMITIQQLLNHTSGIENYTEVLGEKIKNNQINFNDVYSSNDLINLVIDKPLYFKPGTDFHYTNTDYVLLGKIIEGVTKKSLENELQHRLIKPLHLKNTFYTLQPLSDELISRMAHGYAVNDTFQDEPKDVTLFNLSWANAAGAIISNTHDTALWMQALFQNKAFSAKQMQAFQTCVDAVLPHADKSVCYGLGIIHDERYFNEEAWWHSGSTLGYSALMVYLPNRNLIITAAVNHVTHTRDLFLLINEIIN